MSIKRYIFLPALKITAIYLIISILWISFSDRMAFLFASDSQMLSLFQTYKGIFFVLFTSLLLYFFIKTEIRNKTILTKIVETSENLYKSLFENANDAIFLIKKDIIVECNNETCKMFGCNKTEIINNSPVKFSPQHQADGSLSSLKAEEYLTTAMNGTPLRFEWIHNKLNGELFDAEVSLNPLNVSGEDLLLVIIRNISERKEYEIQLRENQLFIKRITEQSPDIIYIYDVNLEKNIYTNRDIGEVLGYEPNEISLDSKSFFEKYIHPEDLVQFSNFEALIEDWTKEYVYEYEYRIKSKSGEWHWFSGKEKEFQRENDRISTVIGTVRDITDRKKNEEAILNSENKFYQIFNNNQNLMFIFDLEEKIRLDINKTYETITGYSKEEVIGIPLSESNIVKEQDIEKYFGLLDTLREKKEFSNEELIVVTKSGEEKVLLTSGQLLFIDNKSLVLIEAKDITEQKIAQNALSESEEKYRTLFEKSKDPTLLIHNNKFVDCNSAAIEILKLKNQNDIFEVHPSALSPEYQPDGQKSLEKAEEMMRLAHVNGYHRFEWDHIDSNKNIFPVEVSLTTIFIKGEEMIYTIWRNVAERKKAEKALIISEQRLRKIVDHAFDALYISDLKGSIKDVNQISCKALGYTRDELLSMTIMQIDAAYPKLEDCLKVWNSMQDNNSVAIEGTHIKKDKTRFPVEITAGKIIIDGKEMIIGFARDITDRKKQEQIIRDSEIRYRTIFENISDGIAIIDEQGKFISVNPAYCKMHNLTHEHFTELTVPDLLHPSNKNAFDDYISSIDKTGKFENEIIEKLQDGTPIYTHIKGTKINLNNQNYYLAVIRDITEKKELERKMITAIVSTEEKERERIARDLHDGLGPILSTIKLYNQWSQNPKTKTSKKFLYEKSAETIEESIRALREISANLSPHILTNFGLVAALKSFIERINIANEIVINFETNLEIRIDTTIESTLYRILTECMNNTIKYANADVIDLKIMLDSDNVKTNYSDNGVGFDLEKELKNPKGQGLYNILNRVNTIGGLINIKSSENKGTNINIEIKL